MNEQSKKRVQRITIGAGFFLNKMIKIVVILSLAIGLIGLGQGSQLLKSTDHEKNKTISEWVSDNQDRQDILDRYNLSCHSKKTEKDTGDIIKPKLISFKECAKSVGAEELYAVIHKANAYPSPDAVAWPLNLMF